MIHANPALTDPLPTGPMTLILADHFDDFGLLAVWDVHNVGPDHDDPDHYRMISIGGGGATLVHRLEVAALATDGPGGIPMVMLRDHKVGNGHQCSPDDGHPPCVDCLAAIAPDLDATLRDGGPDGTGRPWEWDDLTARATTT